VFVTMLVGAVACSTSSGSSNAALCSHVDPCPNDPPQSQADISQCESMLQCTGYEAYLNCTIAQVKCTAGIMDQQATQDGIAANCASQASAVSGGCAVFNGGGSCGTAGLRCCKAGKACEEGCCDSTGMCVLEQQQCASGTDAGGSIELCTNGVCMPCGDPGGPCCNWQDGIHLPCNGCCQGSVANGVCIAFGATCDGDGGATLVCSGMETCQPCGGNGGPCCPGQTCPGTTASNPLYCATQNTSANACLVCGIDGEVCCPGKACPGATTATPLWCVTYPQDPEGTCLPCGNSGAPCCTNVPFPGTPCNSGEACVSGVCP